MRLADKLAAGADPNASFDARSSGRKTTPLCEAAQHGDVPAVWLLLGAGADPDRAASDGTTPLMFAAGNGYLDAARLLLDASADPSLADSDGETPLLLAAMNGQPKVLRLLLARGAAMNAVDSGDGGTAFHTACYRNQAECAEALARAGCDIGLKDNGGRTGWQLAEAEGHAAVVARLQAVAREQLRAAQEREARAAADQAAAEAAAEAAAVARAAATATAEALRREAESKLPAFVAGLYASDQGIGIKVVMKALAEHGGWGAMATKAAAQEALQCLRGDAAEGEAAVAARTREAREAAAAAAVEVMRREAEAELPGFVASLWGANKDVGMKFVMRSLAEQCELGGWGRVARQKGGAHYCAVQDALHGLRKTAALRQLEEAKSLEDPSEELLELLQEAERFFDGSRPKRPGASQTWWPGWPSGARWRRRPSRRRGDGWRKTPSEP
jgi:hypothetical protein